MAWYYIQALDESADVKRMKSNDRKKKVLDRMAKTC